MDVGHDCSSGQRYIGAGDDLVVVFRCCDARKDGERDPHDPCRPTHRADSTRERVLGAAKAAGQIEINGFRRGHGLV